MSGVDLLGLGTYRLGTELPPKRTNTDIGGGSGAHGSWKPYWGDYQTYAKWLHIALAAQYVYPDAGRHMLHYLSNTGRTLTVGVSWMVMNSGRARSHFHMELNSAMGYVEEFTELNKFKSFRIVGTWDPGANDKEDSGNWFYAVGSYDAVGSASVEVLPNCEYKMHFTYTFFDRYNWDDGKHVDVLNEKVQDNELGRLHKVGLAKEYEMTGKKELTVFWKKGFRFETHWRNLMSDGRTGR